MRTAILIIMVFMIALFTTFIEPFTAGPEGGSVALAMMGSGGGMGGMGGMGGHGSSGIGEWIFKMWKGFSDNPNISQQQKDSEADKLRQQIREKRRELSDLVQSPNPDKELIDEKIKELNRLESELDNKVERY